MVLKNTCWEKVHLSLGELGHGLGAFGHGVLGELTGEDKADGRLNVAARQGGALVHLAELAGLSRNTLEGIADEVVHNRHTLLRDARLGMNLLEDLVDVTLVGLSGTTLSLGLFDSLLDGFSHD